MYENLKKVEPCCLIKNTTPLSSGETTIATTIKQLENCVDDTKRLLKESRKFRLMYYKNTNNSEVVDNSIGMIND